MWNIIPENTKEILSEYELALLLLSAYLHDIGMTPQYDMVHKHFQCLTTSTKNILPDVDKETFQKWIDLEGDEINLENDIIEDHQKAANLGSLQFRRKDGSLYILMRK